MNVLYTIVLAIYAYWAMHRIDVPNGFQNLQPVISVTPRISVLTVHLDIRYDHHDRPAHYTTVHRSWSRGRERSTMPYGSAYNQPWYTSRFFAPLSQGGPDNAPHHHHPYRSGDIYQHPHLTDVVEPGEVWMVEKMIHWNAGPDNSAQTHWMDPEYLMSHLFSHHRSSQLQLNERHPFLVGLDVSEEPTSCLHGPYKTFTHPYLFPSPIFETLPYTGVSSKALAVKAVTDHKCMFQLVTATFSYLRFWHYPQLCYYPYTQPLSSTSFVSSSYSASPLCYMLGSRSSSCRSPGAMASRESSYIQQRFAIGEVFSPRLSISYPNSTTTKHHSSPYIVFCQPICHSIDKILATVRFSGPVSLARVLFSFSVSEPIQTASVTGHDSQATNAGSTGQTGNDAPVTDPELVERIRGPDALTRMDGEDEEEDGHIKDDSEESMWDPDQVIQPDSAIELKVYGLGHMVMGQAISDTKYAIESVNWDFTADAAIDPSDQRYMNAELFSVVPGTPGKGGNKIDATSRIRFAHKTYANGKADWLIMEDLRKRLIDMGYEVYWSTCAASDTDRRPMMKAYFQHVDGPKTLPTDDAARDALRDYLVEKGVIVDSIWGKLGQAGRGNEDPTLLVRLVIPSSVPTVEALDIFKLSFDVNEKPDHATKTKSALASISYVANYDINIIRFTNTITPLNPTSIVMSDVAEIDDELLIKEAKYHFNIFLRENTTKYTKKDTFLVAVERVLPDWVMITSSSTVFAKWMTGRPVTFGAQEGYISVYEANRRQCKNKEQADFAERKREGQGGATSDAMQSLETKVAELAEEGRRNEAARQRDMSEFMRIANHCLFQVTESQATIKANSEKDKELYGARTDITKYESEKSSAEYRIEMEEYRLAGIQVEMDKGGQHLEATYALVQSSIAKKQAALAKSIEKLADAQAREQAIMSRPLAILPASYDSTAPATTSAQFGTNPVTTRAGPSSSPTKPPATPKKVVTPKTRPVSGNIGKSSPRTAPSRAPTGSTGARPSAAAKGKGVQDSMQVELGLVRFSLSHMMCSASHHTLTRSSLVIITYPPRLPTDPSCHGPRDSTRSLDFPSSILLLLFFTVVMTVSNSRCILSFHVFLFLSLMLLAQPVTANETPLKIISLNCHSLGAASVTKLMDITDIVDRVNPHILVLLECGFAGKSAFPWSHPQYQSYLWPSLTTNTACSIAIFARNDVTVLRKVDPFPRYVGRMAAIDVAFEGDDQQLNTTRVLGMYAPTAKSANLPKNQTNTREDELPRDIEDFWTGLTTFLREVPRWVAVGDVNTSLHAWEITGYGNAYTSNVLPKSRSCYRRFLSNTGAIDAWEEQLSVNVWTDYTYSDYKDRRRRHILDRAASSPGLTFQYIAALPAVSLTDHRPLLIKILIGARIAALQDSYKPLPGRLRRPLSIDDPSIEGFRTLVTQRIQPYNNTEVTNHDTFDRLLAVADQVMVSACNQSFKRKTPKPSHAINPAAFSPEVKGLKKRHGLMGRIIAALKTGDLSDKRYRFPNINEECCQMTEGGVDLDIPSVRKQRNFLITSIRAAKRNPHYVPTPAERDAIHKAALKGGSLKQIFYPHQSIRPSLLLAPATAQTELATGPDDVLRVVSKPEDRAAAFTTHFNKTFTHAGQVPTTVQKPWLQSGAGTPFAARVQADTEAVWPVAMTEDDLRTLLQKGNPTPSPGPDTWEKWALKVSGPEFLRLILKLCNFVIFNNYFPERLKGNFISPLFKKGDSTNPSNYRPIVFGNLLHNLITTWYTKRIQNIAWRSRLLPDTQIFTQLGTQLGDLTLFLSEASTAARLMDLTLYALKRDHIKGFDYLSPQAFHDACVFFGIPLTMVEFDKARTADVWLKVKLHDAIGDRFYTNGQTKQGDSASPIKYTLSMAMQTAYLLHTLQAADLAVIKTVNGAKGLYHTIADQVSVKLLCVEAMDDSIFFATSWPALVRAVTLSEQFGQVYGILTAWDSVDKTVCFHLGKKPDPTGLTTVRFVDADGNHDVPVVDSVSILRTPIDDVTQGQDAIRRVIDGLPFPAGAKLSLSLIHRAMWMLAVPKILPKLNLLPIMPDQAKQLDDLMTRKVAACLQVETTSTCLLSLPLSKHGFDLPSIYRLNAKAAVNTVLRALNHHLPIIRMMAQITMANWSCQASSCTDPLERTIHGSGRPAERTLGGKGAKAVAEQNAAPPAWRIAGEYLRLAKLSVLHTDQSALLNNASFFHVASRIRGLNPTLPVAPLDYIVPEINPYIPVNLFKQRLERLETSGTPSQACDATRLLQWWKTIRPQHALTTYDPGLLLPVTKRRALSAAVIRANSRTAPRDPTRRPDTWATDGSHVDLRTTNKSASTTAAVVGQTTSTYVIKGLVTTSGHGELMGLIAALHIIKLENPTGSANLLTDYMNGITAIERARAPTMKITQWAYRPQSELYTWLGMLVKAQQNAPVAVRHVKAHTAATDPDSLLNDAADLAAKRAHSTHTMGHATLPPPTGYMRAYVPYDHLRGYAPDSWQSILDDRLADLQFQALPPKHQGRLQYGRLGSPDRVRPYFYTKSPAKLVTKVQYLARAGHLESDYLIWKKGKRFTPACSLCGFGVGTHRHLYRECPVTQPHRDKAITEAVKRFRPPRLRDMAPDRLKVELARIRPVFERFLVDLIHGNYKPEYWCGLTGTPPEPLDGDDASQAHDCAIQLAAHIYGRWIHGKNDGSLARHKQDEFPNDQNESDYSADHSDSLGSSSPRHPRCSSNEEPLSPTAITPLPSRRPPITSLPAPKQWVHYGGRRHTQLAQPSPQAQLALAPETSSKRGRVLSDELGGPSKRARVGTEEESADADEQQWEEKGERIDGTNQRREDGVQSQEENKGTVEKGMDVTGDPGGPSKRTRSKGARKQIGEPSKRPRTGERDGGSGQKRGRGAESEGEGSASRKRTQGAKRTGPPA